MKNLTDQEILLKVKNGEISYFEFIVKKYTKPIYGFIFKKIYNKQDIEDIVQNSFISFYKAIYRFDEKRPVLPYLFEIVKNEMKMYFRSKKQTLPLNEAIYMEEKNSLELFEADIDKLLSKLNKNERKAILMLCEGYSYEEIASRLDKPLNTVKTLIRRARLKLINLKKNDKT